MPHSAHPLASMPGSTPEPPFLLFDDARPGGGARLYQHPCGIIRADRVEDIAAAVAKLRAARAQGLEAAGFIAYEAAAAFEPALAANDKAAPHGGTAGLPPAPLLWFGLFSGFTAIAGQDVPGLLGNPAGAWIGAPRPLITPADHAARLTRLQALIGSGDIYQANLTYRADVAMAGAPLALFARLRAQSAASHGAVVVTGAETLLSLSPELFFALTGNRLECRPMKGTARRGPTPADDAAAAQALAQDPKQRAENLMIVDLMRNDLARVAVPGSVSVPRLFATETYPTVHQMVSDICAQLAPGKDALDVLAALFPCGSITGAPKIRAMQAIAEAEAGMAPRGAYTGAIGWLSANGDARFSVAIRTLSLPAGHSTTNSSTARFGVGGGIVADSVAAAEWDETRAKGDFLTHGQRRFDLVETMAFDPLAGLLRLERHLERMRASAALFGFDFDRHVARNELQAATFRLREPSKVRLLLGRTGAVAIETAALPNAPTAPVPVAIVPLPVAASDFRLRHKTTDRAFYDESRARMAGTGAFEVVFADADGFLTEGSFTSLFVHKGGRLVTPPLARGLLPGVLRAEMLATNKAEEGDVVPQDLAGGFYIGNALRGLIPAFVAANQVAP